MFVAPYDIQPATLKEVFHLMTHSTHLVTVIWRWSHAEGRKEGHFYLAMHSKRFIGPPLGIDPTMRGTFYHG